MSEQEEPSSEEDRLVELIYNRMIDSISTDVAASMHRMIKTGAIPYSNLLNPESRRDIYPSVHPTDDDMEESLQEYVTEVPPSKRLRRMESTENNSNSSQNEQVVTVETTTTTTTETSTQQTSSTMVTRGHHASTTTDIYGRVPPKEPKTTAKCPVCSRYVSTSRFAPHLDKCMGIGTMSRAAAQNHSILS